MNVLAPEVRNFVRRKVQNVAQIYSEHFCFCYTTKQTKNHQKKRIRTAITKSEFESQIYVYIFREVELKTD